MSKQRLDKILGHLGIGTRKEIDRLARVGYITLDGVVMKDSSHKFDPNLTRIEIDGEEIVYREFFHLLLHKPAGYITSTKDRDGTPITHLFDEEFQRDWMPVGRLDKDTEGLLFLTTDGELAHRLTHPRWKVEKRYYVELEKPATSEDVEVFVAGTLELEGEILQPAELHISPDPKKVELIIREGKYHQIKRMFILRDNAVTYLKRLSMGPLTLPDDLAKGEYRYLEDEEEAALYEAVGLESGVRRRA